MKPNEKDIHNLLVKILSNMIPDSNQSDLKQAIQLAWDITNDNSYHVPLMSLNQSVDSQKEFLSRTSKVVRSDNYDRWIVQELQFASHIPSIRFNGAQSLGSEMVSVLSLAVVIYQWLRQKSSLGPLLNIPDRNMPPFALVSLRLIGVRQFLHPASDEITLSELRGRYIFIYLLTQAVAEELLMRVSLPSVNYLACSLGRSLLLVGSYNVEYLLSLVKEQTERLRKIYSAFSIETRIVNLEHMEFVKGNLGIRYLDVNQDIIDKNRSRLSFEPGEIKYEPSHLRDYLCRLDSISAAANYVRLRKTRERAKSFSYTGTSIEEYMDIWYYFESAPDYAHEICLYKNNFLAGSALSSNHPLLQHSFKDLVAGSTTYGRIGVLRLDGNNFAQNLADKGGNSLISLLAYSNFFREYFLLRVPKVCEDFNNRVPFTSQVAVLFSANDDIVIAGPVDSLSILGEELVKDYSVTTGGSMSFGIGIGISGMLANELSHAALLSLVGKKSNRQIR